MIRYVTTVLVLFVFALEAWAQNFPPHQHDVAAADVIDGSVHPELIPDAVAYRLYLVAVSAGPAALPDERARQHSNLQRAGLSDEDIQSAAIVLANFKTQYSALIDQYNQTAEATKSLDGMPLFLAKRDALVQATRDALKSSLTPRGMAGLHVSIQREKAKMKVAAQEAQR
jgi:hypothetical protein